MSKVIAITPDRWGSFVGYDFNVMQDQKKRCSGVAIRTNISPYIWGLLKYRQLLSLHSFFSFYRIWRKFYVAYIIRKVFHNLKILSKFASIFYESLYVYEYFLLPCSEWKRLLSVKGKKTVLLKVILFLG